MTALNRYQRLEATGLWRADATAQRVEVIVSIGDATLVITDLRDRALTHWSLAAVARSNPGQEPAIYHPDGDPDETLELGAGEVQMTEAIETLRGAVARRRPHPGRLRLLSLGLSVLAVLALGLFWLPGAARDHALRVVPEVKRAEIGRVLLVHMRSVTGPPCRTPGADAALARLAARLPARDGDPGRLLVVRDGVEGTAHLPGGTILIGRDLVEDHDGPDVLAGHIIAERLRIRRRAPLADLLEFGGLPASIRLLATGGLPDALLSDYARRAFAAPPLPLDDGTLLAGFEAWQVRAAPYAYARDVTGETTLALIEADPFANTAPEPLLTDADWQRLQGICGA